MFLSNNYKCHLSEENTLYYITTNSRLFACKIQSLMPITGINAYNPALEGL